MNAADETAMFERMFERKVNQMAQAIENNRNVTMNELFPFGSASQQRRMQVIAISGKLATEIRRELQHNPFKKVTTTTSTQLTEPQTAAYQATVDNVHFEQTATARHIKSDFNICNELKDDRIDYVVDLEQRIKWALATNGRRLSYRLLN